MKRILISYQDLCYGMEVLLKLMSKGKKRKLRKSKIENRGVKKLGRWELGNGKKRIFLIQREIW